MAFSTRMGEILVPLNDEIISECKWTVGEERGGEGRSSIKDERE